MEHIVQFGINLDDEAIKNIVIANASRELKRDLYTKANNELFTYYGEPSETFQTVIKEFFEEHKKEIIETASRCMANKLARSKKYRDLLDEKIDEQFD